MLDTRYQLVAGTQLQCVRGACLLRGRKDEPSKRNLCTLACSRRPWEIQAVSTALSTPSGLGSPTRFRLIHMLMPIAGRIVTPTHKTKGTTECVAPTTRISTQRRKCLVHSSKFLHNHFASQHIEQISPVT